MPAKGRQEPRIVERLARPLDVRSGHVVVALLRLELLLRRDLLVEERLGALVLRARGLGPRHLAVELRLEVAGVEASEERALLDRLALTDRQGFDPTRNLEGQLGALAGLHGARELEELIAAGAPQLEDLDGPDDRRRRLLLLAARDDGEQHHNQ